MSVFKLASTENAAFTMEFVAPNVGVALEIAVNWKWWDADVWQDDAYLFTLGNLQQGFWTIYTNPELAENPDVPIYG